MKKTFLGLFSLLAVLGMTSCGVTPKEESHEINESSVDEMGNLVEPLDVATNHEDEKPHGEYEEGVVLVKTYQDPDYATLDLPINHVEPLYPNSPWKKIVLDNETSFNAVKYLRSTGLFEQVDYDYVMNHTAELESIDVSGNPYAAQQSYIASNGIGNAWAYGHANHLGGKDGGGSPDVVVAVIDTGVDYNHIDLRNNIWTNTGEIPGNGIDDDNNGYIDDIRGWDCVNEDNDPIDDNGHGTHVAGIIAAENNKIGTVGVAFNCKVMPIKAGTSSGSFTNADIAQAVQYAYMNGASVINMSFGGSSISLAVEDALSDAYNQCVLVAAAGNSGLCSQPGCPYCAPNCMPFYPASLPYVVGVMSCSGDGSCISGFSNYDHAPYHYNQWEYDCYACGEQVMSTWPNNKNAALSGTSMASPVVAGIAALIRSAYPDRDIVSTKYIHSQLTNAGTTHPYTRIGNSLVIDNYHPVCDAYEALTNVPAPHIYNLYNYYAFDSVELSSKNNGDGFIDAGETIRLGIELQNRGGKATNVTAKIDTIRNDDPNLTDPNIQILEDTIHMDAIGTYSVQDGGKIYDGDRVVGMENAFLIKIDENTQNGYVCSINLNLEYYNGLENDNTKYTGECSFSITINSGYRLSGTITEDTTFTADRKYVITDSLVIAASATVTFEEGCEITFFSNSKGYIDSTVDAPAIDVFGELNLHGTRENMITLGVNPLWENCYYFINTRAETAVVDIEYSRIDRALFNSNLRSWRYGWIGIKNSIIENEKSKSYGVGVLKEGRVWNYGTDSYINCLDNCFVDLRAANGIGFGVDESHGSVFVLSTRSNSSSSALQFRPYFNDKSTTPLNVSDNCFAFEDELVYDNNRNKVCIFGSYRPENATVFRNNVFITTYIPTDLSHVVPIDMKGTNLDCPPLPSGNLFAPIYKDYQNQLFLNNFDQSGNALLNPNDETGHDDSVIWPYIKDISVLDSDNNKIHTVGTEKNKVKVVFSREMDTSNEFSLFYGSWYPYADYQIKGDYVSDTVWEGDLQVKANIEGGIQYFSSKGGCAKDDSFKTLIDNAGAFTFNIDTSSAFAMNLQANSTNEGVELNWVQDDYDTLMGYNVYRSESKDGNFVRINPSIIPAGENTFLDDGCEPGKNYWYTFTVVLSDFTESAPAGKVNATAMDTIAPNIYHTPVNQGYVGNNLVINCTISDNIAVKSATLYYRTKGEAEWSSMVMSKTNDRFSATIIGRDLTEAGIEYYIVASDTVNSISKGSAESPYSVVVKDPSSLSRIGDVDGDGTITTRDALMIIQCINGDLLLSDDEFIRADLDGSGVLNSMEALRILQYINGNVTTLSM